MIMRRESYLHLYLKHKDQAARELAEIKDAEMAMYEVSDNKHTSV